MNAIGVPFHFIATFLVTVVSAAAVWVTIVRPQFAPAKRGSRWSFGVGWALLSAGELLHGSQIVESELDLQTAAMRAGAYAFLVVGLISAKDRPKGGARAAPAVAGAGGGSAVMPAFLSFSAAWLAVRSPLRGARRLALAFLLFGVSEVLFGAGGSGDQPSGMWLLAHGVRTLAGISVGAWLWLVIRTSIQVRFVLVFISMMLVVVVAIASSMTQVFTQNVREQSLERAALQGQLQRRTLEERERQAAQAARILAEEESNRKAVFERSPALTTLAQRLQGPGGLFSDFDFLAFLDPQGSVMAISAASASGAPTINDAEAVSLAGTAVVQSALAQLPASSVDLLGSRKIAIIGSHPVVAPRGSEAPGAPAQLAGAVVLGAMLDRSLLDGLPGIDISSDEQEVTVITSEQVLVSTLLQPESLFEDRVELQREVFELGRVYTVEGRSGGIDYFHSYVPLERRDGEVVAALIISVQSDVVELTQRDVGRALFLFALLAAAIAVALSLVSGARITQPIRDLTSAAQRVREGDLGARVDLGGEDEVGELAATFDQMTASLSKLTTDLRQSAEEEFRLRTQLETILQSMADGVVAVDVDAKIVALNREGERILGLKAAKAIGMRIDEALVITDEENSELVLPIYELSEGSMRGFTASRRDGRITPVAVSSSPIRTEDNNLLGAVALMRDLTAEIEVEKMKTEFLSNISHELRTPLTPIKGYTNILKRRKVTRQQQLTFLDNIEQSVQRLERIVEMLVDFSAMQAGRLMPRKSDLDLDSTTAELVTKWQATAPKHTFQRRGFSKLPPLEADEKQIYRAIDELIDNAVKFSPKGGKISLKAQLDGAPNAVRISVSDEGIGIAPDDIDDIFLDFTQVDASETREFGGLGLGLAYVRQIVEAHEGFLEVTSRIGQGSTFSMVLPGVIGGRRTRTKAAKGAGAPISSSRRARSAPIMDKKPKRR